MSVRIRCVFMQNGGVIGEVAILPADVPAWVAFAATQNLGLLMEGTPPCDCIASGNPAKPKQHGADPHAKNCAVYLPDRVGVLVICCTCGNMKQPIGRSGPLGAMYCDNECSGYREQPYPGSLWPGELASDFGYPVGRDGTREVV